MSFLDAYPERKVQGPQIPGQPVFKQAKVTQLRRQQLIDLAYAFDIPVSGTKAEILPVMIEAEEQGVFQQQPKRPEYLIKASRTPDEPPVDWESHRAPLMDQTDFRMLQRLAKEHGVDSFGKGKQELYEKLHEMGVV